MDKEELEKNIYKAQKILESSNLTNEFNNSIYNKTSNTSTNNNNINNK